MSGIIVLLVIATLAVAGISILTGLHRQDQRWQRMYEFAVAHDWEALAEDASLVARYHGLPFGRGRRRRARNVLRGTHRGRPFTAFEYTYTDGDDNRVYAVYAIDLGRPVPVLELQERGIGTALGRIFGMDSVPTGDAEFDRRFVAGTGDAESVAQLLTPSRRAVLLERWRPDTSRLRFEGTELRTWTRGHTEPQQVPPMLDYLCGVAES